MARLPRTAVWLYAAAAAIYLLDRLSKAWAEASLAGRGPIEVIPKVLSFTLTTNSGGAFGLGRSAPLLFVTATIAVTAAIVAGSFRVRHQVTAVALGLVLGGALGNLTDRIVRGPGLSGRVVDFIDFHVWPVFNLADSAIVIGIGLLLLDSILHRESP